MRIHRLFLVLLLLVLPATVLAQECYCTLEDAWWGNAKLSFNGVAIPALIDSLIVPGDPVVLGAPGRSVTFEDGSESCIVAGLPAGGKACVLPPSLGDAVVDTNCVIPEDFPANKHWKFRNKLLGEAMALSLNVRLDPDLLVLPVEPVMYTVEALPGDDGLHGTADDSLCADCDTMTVRMPDLVMAALVDSMGIDPTVGDVLAFANTTLGGGEIYDARPRDVWHAVKNLNRAFKRCRFLVSGPVDSIVVIPLKSTEGSTRGREEEPEAGMALSITGAVGARSVLHLSVSEASRVHVAAYNVAGRRVAVLADRSVGAGEMTMEFPADRALPCGVYLIRASATGVTSGRSSSQAAKVIVVR